MATPILMPMPGQMTEECTLLVWHKHEGDPVSRGDVLFEIETDKAIMDVQAYDNGTLLRVLVAEGSTVPVNTICAWLGAPGEVIPDRATSESAIGPDAGPQSDDEPVASTSRPNPDSRQPAEATPPMSASAPAISPRAARLAAELGVPLTSVVGSGPGGRVTERDVEAAADRINRAASADAE